MGYTLGNVREAIENLWPANTAEAWDNVGLTVGQNSAEINRILLAVDAVAETVNEAISVGADLLLTHHPLILRGIMTLAEDTYKGALIAKLIRANCALLAAHTNADVPEAGVSAVLAEALGLQNVTAIEETVTESVGIGRVGDLPETISLQELVERFVKILPKTAVGARVAGARNKPVKRVALLGGSGDSLLAHPKVTVADVYITSDLRHHPASEAVEQGLLTGGPALVDVPHFAAESVWLKTAAKQLRAALPGIEVQVSEKNTDPWIFTIR